MATRQYIGARYVPKFYQNTVDGSTQWQANVVYEPLTWVTLVNGHMYLSKKQVPATVGTPAENIDYWLDVGSYNGMIEDLQEQIDVINEAIAPLVNRKFKFYGDSYGETYTVDSTTITGWLDKIGNIMGISASQYAGSQCASGYGFLGTNQNLQWKSMVNNATIDEDVTDVCFIGGDNDLVFSVTQVTALTNAFSETIALAKTKFPNAKIWVGFCAVDLSDSDTRYVNRCMEMYSKLATQNGAVFMSDLAYCLYDTSLLRMPSHPNNSGTTRLASAISSILKGGSYYQSINNKLATKDTSDSVVVATEFGDVYFSTFKDVLTLTFRGASPNTERFIAKFGTNGYSTVLDGMHTLNVAKITDLPLGHQGMIVLGTVPGFVNYTEGANQYWEPCSILVTYYRGYIQFKPLCLVSLVGYLEKTIKQIMLPSFKFNVPILEYSSYVQ